ncbi:DNA repair protein RAD16 [Polyrhizophydium stewartii]|uniref:DNA repair protein RAD16 n=1 Tax=Polyrhizophydium stewartii TaxID=2732419 RepID=A0ABR4N5V5_9FUNG|nr:hypothetical protein HK105_007042 [Polyrhizophydium stewartii]
MADSAAAATAAAAAGEAAADMLDFHRLMLADLHATPGVENPDPSTGDGLLVAARGLGIHLVLSAVIQIHTSPNVLVLLLNTPPAEVAQLRRAVARAAESAGAAAATDGERIRPDLLRVVNNETPASARAAMYLAGGVIAATSQILVLDMLSKVLPIHLVTGVIVNHAHRLRDTSLEAFALRLFRADNKVGFIQAFSEMPESLAAAGSVIGGLERTMKLLYLRSAYLWPRFHISVKDSLDVRGAVDLIELRVPMTRRMKDIQAAIMDCLHECILEVKRANPNLEADDFKVENALFKSFDFTVRQQLDPIWHRVGPKTKSLVKDLRVLRQLLSFLAEYDAVTFYSFLETILATNAQSTSSMFKIGSTESPWLMLDSAQTVFSAGKERAYRRIPAGSNNAGNGSPEFEGIPPNVEPVLEEPPKWRAVVEVVREILADRAKSGNTGNILVMTASDRSSRQLRQILADVVGPHKSAIAGADATRRKGPRFSSAGSEEVHMRLLRNYFRWKGTMSKVTKTLRKQTSGQTQAAGAGYRPLDLNGAPAPMTFEEEAEQVERFLQQAGADDLQPGAKRDPAVGESASEAQSAFLHIRSYNATQAPMASDADAEGNEGDAECLDDAEVLRRVRPRWIVMFDPDMAFVRQVEVFKALNPDEQIRVYFLVYDNSVEEQRYLTSIRREKEAFERLINQKANMVIPIDQDGRVAVDPEELFWRNVDTRQAGGQRRQRGPATVIVDVREFRSALPSLIHAKHMTLQACTLEVGDYILSPRMCVERKSIPDLISSFKSGRLYTQCEAMCLHYDIPILLIEFEQNRAFSLVSASDVTSSEVSASDLSSRISLLCLTFPKLKTIWSSSPSATAEIFADLKATEEQPVMEDAMAVGVESRRAIDSAFNITPYDVLLSLPGITTKNYRTVMSHARNLRELTEMPLEAMKRMIGDEGGAKLHEFIHANPRRRQ